MKQQMEWKLGKTDLHQVLQQFNVIIVHLLPISG